MPPSPHLRLASSAELRPPLGDDALMALAIADDKRAFAELVTRHEAALRRLAGLLSGDPERARDLVQDALILAWERRHTYQPRGQLKAWLAGIVRNLCARERRKAKVRAFFGLASPPAWTAPAPLDDPFTQVAASDRDRVIAAALTRLPIKMREALALRFVDGLDYDQMASVLGVSASTLRSRVFHGLAQLSAHVPEELLR